MKPVLICRMGMNWLEDVVHRHRIISNYEKLDMLRKGLGGDCPGYNIVVVPVKELEGELKFEVFNADDAQLLDLDKLKEEINKKFYETHSSS